MSTSNQLARYLWIVDTIRRVGHISREDLSRRWIDSEVSNGAELNRRTFYNYREGIYQLFGIEIKYSSSSNSYYIDESGTRDTDITNWMLNTAAINTVLSDAHAVSDRIFLEDVPSAREYLGSFIDAIKNSRRISFTYHPFNRAAPTPEVVLEPYLLKIFKQRWYVAGMNVAEKRIKTYALDRVTNAHILDSQFDMPATFDPAQYFANSYGIVVDQSEPRRVVIRAGAEQARYLRALPLHKSQQEMVHDQFSDFHYYLQLTREFLTELLSMGPKITVIAPPELRTMLTESLRQTLALYEERKP